eukprot:Gb_04388 [translate_table: standard]
MGWGKDTSVMVSPEDSKFPAGKYELVNNKSSPGKRPMNKYMIACAVLASMNSILLGYDVGVMSGAILFIQEDLHLKEVEEEVLVGSLNIVSLVGAAVAGRTSDAIGRRWTMALAALIFLMGAAIMGLAPSFVVLMVGRLLAGIGVGFALMIAPVYTAEVSPASSRGALTSLPEIFINVGILLGYISNYFLSGLPAHLSWRLMLGLGVFPSLFLGLGVLAMPESPRWLVMQNRIEEATIVLLRTSVDQAEADARLSEIIEAAGVQNNENVEKSVWPDGNLDMANIQTPQKNHGEGVWRELFKPTPPIRRMLIIALGIQFFQQASGIDAVVYYSPVVFKEAGIRSQTGLLAATVAVGFAKTGFILVAVFMIDRVGRRPLLLISALGMTVSLVALALGFSFIENASGSHGGAVFLAILAVCCNVAFFSIGLGPVCWVLGTEIFPLRLRAQAASLGVVVNRVVSGVVAMTFLSVSSAITVAGTFSLFAGLSVLCVIFICGYIPETKGKTLEEIVKFFHREESEKMSSVGELELGDTVNLVSKH